MQLLIYWNLFADVKSDQKCRQVIEKVEEAIGMSLLDATVERYWKDKTLFKVHAVSRFEVPSRKDGFFIIMTKAGRLSRNWIINAPTEDGPLEISATSQPGSGMIPGVASVFFNVETVAAPSPNELVHVPIASQEPVERPSAESSSGT